MVSTTQDLYYDPFSREIDVDPYPVWARMRDEQPVYFNEQYDFYALSRFADVLDGSLRHDTLISGRGTVMELLSAPPEIVPEWILFRDPPLHTILRKLVNRAFTPRRVHDLEPRVRELARRYLDGFAGASSFDFVQDFAARVPMTVIGSMLGIPEDEQEMVRKWFDDFEHMDNEREGFDYSSGLNHVDAYFLALANDRRRQSRDDMMTDLVQAEVLEDDGSTRSLSDKEISQFITLLAGAGTETVSLLMASMMVLLWEHPDQRARLHDDPSLLPRAIEEGLRYEPPSPVQGRWAAGSVEYHGTVIPEGSKVLLLTGAAARDEREYDRPDDFDITREAERHLSFGYGIHFCLGAALARLEATVVLEETLARFPVWDVDLAHAERRHTSSVRGFHRLPITVG
jgi:cytochrome P450